MRNILISIKPQYVCKILDKEKILEIRKSIPKCELPCKVYIYCTKGNKELRLFNQTVCSSFKIPRTKTYSITQQKAYTKFIGDESQSLNGKVVAEFILNKIDKIEICDPYIFRNNEQEDWKYFEKNACLTCEQMMEYIGYGEDHDGWDKKYDIGYAWHIDDLIIYDTPRELSEFQKDLDCDDYPCNKGKYCEYDYYDYCEGCKACSIDFDGTHCIYKQIKRPPQSYMFVEGE